MDLGAVVLQIRGADTRFGNRVMGAAELALAQDFPLVQESAFVVPVADAAPENRDDTSINQAMRERVAVVVALCNDTNKKDLLGASAYSLVDTVRTQLFTALLGWPCPGTDDLMSYAGGRLIGYDKAWLWYQFEFEAVTRLVTMYDPDAGALPYLSSIYTQWKVGGDGVLPLPEGESLPTALLSDPVLAEVIELPSGFSSSGFKSGFETLQGVLNKKRGVRDE